MTTRMRRFVQFFSEPHPLPPLPGPFYPHTIRHNLGVAVEQCWVRRDGKPAEQRWGWACGADEVLIDLPAGRWDVAVQVDGKPPHIETITVP